MHPFDHPRIPDLISHPSIDDLVGMEKKRGRGQGSRTRAPWSASGRGVASPWLPCTVPPVSRATPAFPAPHRAPWTRDSVALDPPLPCPCIPGAAQATAARARSGPPAELAPRHPAPLRHASLAVATVDADRRRGSPHPRVAAVLCRTETVPTVEHLTERWTRTVPS